RRLAGGPRAAAPGGGGDARRAPRQARRGGRAASGCAAPARRAARMVSMAQATKTRRRTRTSKPPGITPLGSPFPPIADYGFLSDCHTGALVASDGAVEWMCLPHFDSPSIFGSMLDRGAGSFRVGP